MICVAECWLTDKTVLDIAQAATLRLQFFFKMDLLKAFETQLEPINLQGMVRTLAQATRRLRGLRLTKLLMQEKSDEMLRSD